MVQLVPDLGRTLVDEGVISLTQLDQGLQAAQRNDSALEEELVRLGFASENAILQAIANKLGLEFVDLPALLSGQADEPIDIEVATLINEVLAYRYRVLSIACNHHQIRLAMADPLNILAIDDIRLTTGYDVQPVLASSKAITAALNKYYGRPGVDEFPEEMTLEQLQEMMDEATKKNRS